MKPYRIGFLRLNETSVKAFYKLQRTTEMQVLIVKTSASEQELGVAWFLEDTVHWGWVLGLRDTLGATCRLMSHRVTGLGKG